MRKVVVLFSAGVESTSLVVHYLSRGAYVYPVYVRSGMPWEDVERHYALKLWHDLRRKYGHIAPVRTVFVKGSRPATDGVPMEENQIEIPLRNMILTVQTAVVAHRKGVDTIGVGSLGIYPFPDNNREYFDKLEDLISTGLRRRIIIDTPFMGMEKWDVIRRFAGKAPYHLTFSCASPVGRIHCGVCAKCRERREGFERAGLKDPTPYWSL